MQFNYYGVKIARLAFLLNAGRKKFVPEIKSNAHDAPRKTPTPQTRQDKNKMNQINFTGAPRLGIPRRMTIILGLCKKMTHSFIILLPRIIIQ